VVAPRPLLFVDHATALGGAEHSLLLLLRHLDRTRWALHLACPEGALSEAAEALGVAVHPLPLPRLRRSAEALRRLAGGGGGACAAWPGDGGIG